MLNIFNIHSRLPFMDEIRREFFEIVTQVRGHLEYRRALGLYAVSIEPALSAAFVPNPGIKPGPRAPEPQLRKAAVSTGLTAVQLEMENCSRCKLCKSRKNILFGEGNPDASLVFIGEEPGQEEDEQGLSFAGPAGQLLTDIIEKGMKLKREDVYICNIVKCRPPENRKPEPDELEACEPFLIRQIEAIKPRFIIGLGNVAVKAMLKTTEGITALRGKWKTYQGIPVMPTFHPAYLLKSPGDKKLVWEDIKMVMAEMDKLKKV